MGNTITAASHQGRPLLLANRPSARHLPFFEVRGWLPTPSLASSSSSICSNSRPTPKANSAWPTLHYDFDAAGNQIQTTRYGTDNSPIVQELSTYDTAGRRTSSTPASNGSGASQAVTNSEYFDASNHRVNTTTYPDGGTRVETHYQDGSMLTVTGSAVFPLQYSYGLSTTTGKYGEVTKETKLGGGSQTNEWFPK